MLAYLNVWLNTQVDVTVYLLLCFRLESDLCDWILSGWQYDESKSQETIERKINNAPAGQGTVRMLTREEWEEIREVRPRTPFESKLARPNARIRTEEPLRLVRHFLVVNLISSFWQYICAQIFLLHSLAFTFTSLLLGYSLHIVIQVNDESAEC